MKMQAKRTINLSTICVFLTPQKPGNANAKKPGKTGLSAMTKQPVKTGRHYISIIWITLVSIRPKSANGDVTGG